MQLFVRVRPLPVGLFTAEVVGLPEARMTAATRADAVAAVRGIVADMISAGELSVLDFAAPAESAPPAAAYAPAVVGFARAAPPPLRTVRDKSAG